MKFPADTVIIGLVATLAMDVWGVLRKPLLGWPAADYRPVGRWIAHLARGKWHHDAIGKAAPVRGEALTGWAAHYGTGVAFATGLLALVGPDWARSPSLAPALAFGLVTVLFPFLVMQPSMGLGVAASRTPNPTAARTQSLVTHAVFGVGLYLGGLVTARI